MTRLSETHRRINAEIAQEKAVALGRAGERLEAALAHVVTVGCRLDAATDPVEEARLLGEYETARAGALHARLALLIQRGSGGAPPSPDGGPTVSRAAPTRRGPAAAANVSAAAPSILTLKSAAPFARSRSSSSCEAGRARLRASWRTARRPQRG